MFQEWQRILANFIVCLRVMLRTPEGALMLKKTRSSWFRFIQAYVPFLRRSPERKLTIGEK